MNRCLDQTRLIDILKDGALVLGYDLSRACLARMLRHVELVNLWNRRINLTALKNPKDSVIFHCLDSLTVLKLIPLHGGMEILDIGTGAGFPGIVIKNMIEDCSMTLLDKHPGKIVFLKYLVKELQLHGISFVNSDVNYFLDSTNPRFFDVIISRAFSSDSSFLGSLHRMLRPGGFLLRMTGRASFGIDYRLNNFLVSGFWQGFLPYSSSFRRVILYSYPASGCYPSHPITARS